LSPPMGIRAMPRVLPVMYLAGVELAEGRKHVAAMWEGFAKRYGKKQGGNLLPVGV